MPKNTDTKQWQNQQKELIIEQLKKTPIIQIACEKIGLNRATFYRWYKADQKFQTMINEAITSGKMIVNDMAESQLISAIKDRNLTAIIFWLKIHHKDYKNRIEFSGEITAKGQLTSEQEKTIIKALKLALLTKSNQSLTPNSNDTIS